MPDDPLELVFYCPAVDGAEGSIISDNFRETFGRECEFPDVKTLGEFLDRNFARRAA